MVLGTTRALIGLVPTIVAAQLVSDLVTGRGRRRRIKRVLKRRTKKRRRRR